MLFPLTRRGRVLCLAAALLVLALWFVADAGHLLVVDQPERADAIIVLEGGTWARITTGLQYLRQGYAPRLLLDTDDTAVVWGVPDGELAKQWIDRLPGNEPLEVATCPTGAESTLGEAIMVQPCLEEARRVLIVTSAYHTRRALAIFRKIDPSRHYSVAASDEPGDFEPDWWRDRDWAKQTLDEWGKMLWWEGIDRWLRWRKGEL